MSFRSRTFSIASYLRLTRETADLSWHQGAHLTLTKRGSGSLGAPLIPSDYIIFVHLQGLDKAPRPHLVQFNMHSVHFCIPQVIKKKSHICSKLNNLRRKADSLPAPSLPQQSKAGQPARPLWGREAVKPGLGAQGTSSGLAECFSFLSLGLPSSSCTSGSPFPITSQNIYQRYTSASFSIVSSETTARHTADSDISHLLVPFFFF